MDQANRDKCQTRRLNQRSNSVSEAVAVVQLIIRLRRRFKAIGVTDEAAMCCVFALRKSRWRDIHSPDQRAMQHRKEVRYYEEAAAKTRDR
jgi:hypothetical protein